MPADTRPHMTTILVIVLRAPNRSSMRLLGTSNKKYRPRLLLASVTRENHLANPPQMYTADLSQPFSDKASSQVTWLTGKWSDVPAGAVAQISAATLDRCRQMMKAGGPCGF